MKKTLAKILALALCAVLLVTGTVFVTLAYLQSQTGVIKNTFTSAGITLKLDEAIVDEDGNPILYKQGDQIVNNPTDNETYTMSEIPWEDYLELSTQEDRNAAASRWDATVKERTHGNNYFLVPGSTYVKDPTVTVVAGSAPCFVVIAVRNTIFKGELSSVYSDSDPDTKDIESQMRANGWHPLDGHLNNSQEENAPFKGLGWTFADDSGNEKDYTLYFYSSTGASAPTTIDHTIVNVFAEGSRDKVINIFDRFTIPSNVTTIDTKNDDNTNKTLEVIAIAVQCEGFKPTSATLDLTAIEDAIREALKAAGFGGDNNVTDDI